MRFVLIHGSWHTGSCWDGVAAALRDDGHDVLAPTLPGNGPDAPRDLSMAETVNPVRDQLVELGWEDIVLVGHSFGGVIVQLLTQAMPERVARAVFHNAYVVLDGQAVFDNVPPSAAGAFQELAVDGALMLPFEVFHGGFLQDLDEDSAREVYAQLSPEPLARSTEPLALDGFFASTVPTSYVHATDDQAFPPEELTWHPGMSERLDDPRIVELPGSHEVLFSNPGALAAALLEAATT